MNLVILLGRLGNDPELKYTNGGTAVANFSLATDEGYKPRDGGEKIEKTEWHSVIVWGKQAENCNQFLSKGKQVSIRGSVKTRSWDDANTGEKKYKTEVHAETVIFLGGGGGNENG